MNDAQNITNSVPVTAIPRAAVRGRRRKYFELDEFLSSKVGYWLSPEFPDTEEGCNLLTSTIASAKKRRDKIAETISNLNVTIQRTEGMQFVLINWDMVEEDLAEQLMIAGYQPEKVSGSQTTTVTKKISQTKVR